MWLQSRTLFEFLLRARYRFFFFLICYNRLKYVERISFAGEEGSILHKNTSGELLGNTKKGWSIMVDFLGQCMVIAFVTRLSHLKLKSIFRCKPTPDFSHKHFSRLQRTPTNESTFRDNEWMHPDSNSIRWSTGIRTSSEVIIAIVLAGLA